MGLLDNEVSNTNYYHDSKLWGGYQFVSLTDIINQFMFVYVGEDKIIPKAKRMDVAFFAQRALAELSFDTFKSHKAEEFTAPPSLQMPLPQDYVNYTKILYVDSSGIKHPLYQTKHTQNPRSFHQNDDISNENDDISNGNDDISNENDDIFSDYFSDYFDRIATIPGDSH